MLTLAKSKKIITKSKKKIKKGPTHLQVVLKKGTSKKRLSEINKNYKITCQGCAQILIFINKKIVFYFY